jgi:polysaccharide export outer membrane protein
MADNLYVNGFTASQVDDMITGMLAKYIRTPRVDIIVKEYKSKFVTVLGPGAGFGGRTGGGKNYLTGRTTIVEIFSQNVSLHQDANLAEVGLRRKKGQTLKLNLFNAILRGEVGQDVALDNGDVIYIPLITKEDNRVYIFGEVAKPGVYAFTGSEMRLLDVVSQAGGFTVFAYEESTKIARGDPTRPEVISADLKKLVEEGDQTQNVTLANGDLVYVPRSFIGDVNRFAKRVRPLLELIIAPVRIITDYDDAYKILTE